MQTALVCLCLCLLSTALSTPVPLPLPGRAAGNCVGQHRILLKGCNAKHGFYVFKYVYSFSTRRNQTQIKKEEADGQSTIPSQQLGEDDARKGLTEDRAAPERGDNGITSMMENGTGLKPKNHSAPGIGRDAHSPRPGTGPRARGGVSIAGPTPASSEGSGDLDLVVEVDDGVSILPEGGRPSKAMAGNRSGVRSEDRDDGAPRGVPVEGAMTAGRERAPATRGDGDEGSGGATVPGQGQEGVKRGTGRGGAALASVTEKMEDVQVGTEGMDEYAYIPDSGSVTVTRGKVGSTARATSFTQISPDKDDEVNIFIGRANIHVGEQETTQAGATVGSKDNGIPTPGTSGSLPGLGVTAAHDGDDDDGIPALKQPEGPATTATPSHGDRVTSSPGDGRPTGDDEDGATTIGDRGEPVAPGPWRVTGGDVTVLVGAGIRGNGDDEVRGEGQRFEGRPGHLAVTTPHHGGDKEAATAVPARGASTHLSTTMASPRVSEGDCTTALGMASSHKASERSRDVGPATPQPRGEGRPGAGVRVQPGGVGLDKPPRMDKAPSSRGKAGSRASSRAQVRAGVHGGDAGARLRTTEARGSLPPQAGRAGGSVAVGKGQEQGRGGKAGVAVAGAGVAAGKGQEQGRGGEARVVAGGAGMVVGKGQEQGRGGEAGVATAGAGVAAGKGQEQGRGGEAGVAVGKGEEQQRGGEAGVAAAGAGVAAGKGEEQQRGGEAGVAAAGAGVGRLPGHDGRRPGAGVPGSFAAVDRSRQVDQVKRADELHVRERAFYALGGMGGSPRGPYASLGSADSSQSSEGEPGSRSDSRQIGLRPAGWGAPGHPHGRWSRGTL